MKKYMRRKINSIRTKSGSCVTGGDCQYKTDNDDNKFMCVYLPSPVRSIKDLTTFCYIYLGDLKIPLDGEFERVFPEWWGKVVEETLKSL